MSDPIKRRVIFAGEPSCTLLLGDCLQILPLVGKVDAVVTDPPYGISHPCDFARRGRGILAATHDWADVCGDDRAFDPTPFVSQSAILFGGIYFADRLPPSSGWLIWDKRVQDGKGVNDQADAELAWTNCVKGARIFRHMWNGFWRDSERGESYHPTQKPVALMRWCIERAGKPRKICDPYMGSGTTGVAAMQLGLSFIGCEIDPGYFDIAVRRITEAREEVSSRLPFAEPERDEQLSLLAASGSA